MSKASKMQMKQREADILELLNQGHSRSDIGKLLCEKYFCTPNAIERQHDNIIKKWVEANKDQVDEAKAQYILRLGHLYQKAYRQGQIKLASDIIEKQAKLMGLYNPKVENIKETPKINIIERNAPLAVVPTKKAENDK